MTFKLLKLNKDGLVEKRQLVKNMFKNYGKEEKAGGSKESVTPPTPSNSKVAAGSKEAINEAPPPAEAEEANSLAEKEREMEKTIFEQVKEMRPAVVVEKVAKMKWKNTDKEERKEDKHVPNGKRNEKTNKSQKPEKGTKIRKKPSSASNSKSKEKKSFFSRSFLVDVKCLPGSKNKEKTLEPKKAARKKSKESIEVVKKHEKLKCDDDPATLDEKENKEAAKLDPIIIAEGNAGVSNMMTVFEKVDGKCSPAVVVEKAAKLKWKDPSEEKIEEKKETKEHSDFGVRAKAHTKPKEAIKETTPAKEAPPIKEAQSTKDVPKVAEAPSPTPPTKDPPIKEATNDKEASPNKEPQDKDAVAAVAPPPVPPTKEAQGTKDVPTTEGLPIKEGPVAPGKEVPPIKGAQDTKDVLVAVDAPPPALPTKGPPITEGPGANGKEVPTNKGAQDTKDAPVAAVAPPPVPPTKEAQDTKKAPVAAEAAPPVPPTKQAAPNIEDTPPGKEPPPAKDDALSINETAKKPKSKEMIEKEEKRDAQFIVACRIMVQIRQCNALESVLTRDQNAILRKFFAAQMENPTPQIIALLHKAMEICYERIMSNGEEYDIYLDGPMMELMKNKEKAKTQLLDVLMMIPDLLPLMWGGRAVGFQICEDKQKSGQIYLEVQQSVKRDKPKSFSAQSDSPWTKMLQDTMSPDPEGRSKFEEKKKTNPAGSAELPKESARKTATTSVKRESNSKDKKDIKDYFKTDQVKQSK